MTGSQTPADSSLPLSDLRVLDATTVIAGPMAGMLLADFGADVIKIEHPHLGDPLREHGESHHGVPLWWTVLGRNKRCITLNLSQPDGQRIFRELAAEADVVVENFRVGTFARWGLDFESLRADNPGLIVAHVTGFGQVGPRAAEPGFGTLAEAMSGFAFRNGEPDGPPTLPPFGLADGVAGLAAAYGILVALHERERSGCGQEVDLAITEPLMMLLEPQIITFDQLGTEMRRTGSRATSNAPRGIYPTADGRWVAVSGSTSATARRLVELAGRPDVADQEWMATAEGRVAHATEIDEILTAWMAGRTHEEVLALCRAAEAPATIVYGAADIVADEQFLASGAITEVPHDVLGTVRMPSMLFRLSRSPGGIRWPGPIAGAHNAEVFEALGIDGDEQQRLRAEGVI